jgi:F0F1-type ATP synthase assembly protein I
MFKTLQLIFAMLACYGLYIGLYGGAAIALAMAGFMRFAERHYEEQDRHEREVQTLYDTFQCLVDKDCECSATHL